MKNIKDCLRRYLEKRGITKDKEVYLIIFFVMLILGVIFGSFFPQYLNTSLSMIAVVFFLIICLIISWLAVIAVFRSLILAGAGLSVLSFIALTYCNIPVSLRTADDALKNILGIGIVYILYVFFSSLFKLLIGDKKAKDKLWKKGLISLMKDMNGGKISFFIFSMFMIFTGSFIWQLYRVMYSIYSSLCIF